ncbi:hypothetical protein ACJX0J_020154, partial [Zea mays]
CQAGMFGFLLQILRTRTGTAAQVHFTLFLFGVHEGGGGGTKILETLEYTPDRLEKVALCLYIESGQKAELSEQGMRESLATQMQALEEIVAFTIFPGIKEKELGECGEIIKS